MGKRSIKKKHPSWSIYSNVEETMHSYIDVQSDVMYDPGYILKIKLVMEAYGTWENGRK